MMASMPSTGWSSPVRRSPRCASTSNRPSVFIITDGGAAPNIVPERAAGRFFVRSETAKDLAALRARVVACLESGAQASGAPLELVAPEPDLLGRIARAPRPFLHKRQVTR